MSDLLGDKISALACTERTFTFRFRSAEAFVEYFRTYYGPTVKAFEAVGDEGRDALFADLVYLVRRRAGTGTGPVAIPATCSRPSRSAAVRRLSTQTPQTRRY